MYLQINDSIQTAGPTADGPKNIYHCDLRHTEAECLY
jgi:hypothetical protein